MSNHEMRGYIFTVLGCLFLLVDVHEIGWLALYTHQGLYGSYTEYFKVFLVLGVILLLGAVACFAFAVYEQKNKWNLRNAAGVAVPMEKQSFKIGQNYVVPEQYRMIVKQVSITQTEGTDLLRFTMELENRMQHDTLIATWEAKPEDSASQGTIQPGQPMLLAPNECKAETLQVTIPKQCDRIFLTIFLETEMEHSIEPNVYEIYPAHYR